MFTSGKLMLLYSETPIHAGAGTGVGAIDLPIQRERVTNWPILQSSGLKGSLRDHFEIKENSSDKLFEVFGPDQAKDGNPADHSGALSVSDSKVLLFPVRSLKGTFGYITCPLALKRLKRDLETLKAIGGAHITDELTSAAQTAVAGENVKVPEEDGKPHSNLFIAISNSVQSGQAEGQGPKGQVVFEEFAFTAKGDAKVNDLAKWLDGLWPGNAPWLDLPGRLAVVPDEVFKDFVEFSTEVITRNKIDDDKGTVAKGALWTEECLPRETLLYSVLLACKPRKKNPAIATAEGVFDYLLDPARVPDRIWVGGDVTIGRGILRTTFK